MPPTSQPDRKGEPARDQQAAAPDRALDESTYGYETSHPSYKLRGAGDWSPPSGEHRIARRDLPQQPPAVDPNQIEAPDKVKIRNK